MRTTIGTVVVAGMMAAGCGDASGPAGPTRAPEAARFGGSVAAGQCARPIAGITPGACVQHHDFLVGRDGFLTATLTWSGTTDMDLVLTEASCGTYDHYGCVLRAESRQGPAVERITLSVRGGETLRFWAHNNSQEAGQYTLEISIP